MRSPRHLFAALIGVLALSACDSVASADPVPAPTSSSRDVQISATFTATPGTAITYDEDLVRSGSRVAVSSRSGNRTTTVMLAVRGLAPERRYGAHAHAERCGDTGEAAGPHFQNVVDPVQPSVDPQYANPQNEIWLDFTTDRTGAATAETTVPWEFAADRRAHSVIIHAMPTATDHGKAGTAGERAACISVEF